MLRELITHGKKAVEAAYKADVAMATGMAVVKNRADKTAELPAKETADNLFFVQKQRIPTGRNAGVAEHSDYDTEFNTVAQGELVTLPQYDRGETFAIDAVTGLTDADKDKVLAAGTDGKLKVATIPSRYLYCGEYNDAGHKLAKIEVLETAITNS